MASVQELTAAIQQLNAQMAAVQLENQNLRQAVQAQAVTIQQLQQPVPAPPVAPPPLPPVINIEAPLQPPSCGSFNGDTRGIKEFLQACKVQFLLRPASFPTDASKVAYIISYLTANALAWASPLVLAEDPVLLDFTAFETAFLAMFKRTSCVYAAEEALFDAAQGTRDVQTYTARFQALLAEVQWPENVRITAYRRGLREELKDELARLDRPATLKQLIETTLQLEYRLTERKSERRRTTPVPLPRRLPARTDMSSPTPALSSTEEPMQVDGVRGPLTSQERQRRRDNNLCLYCGSSSHILRACPICPPRRAEN